MLKLEFFGIFSRNFGFQKLAPVLLEIFFKTRTRTQNPDAGRKGEREEGKKEEKRKREGKRRREGGRG